MAKTERHFLGQEIKKFLRSELVKSYPHHFFPDEDRIVFEKLTFVGVYDLWDRSFGYFTHEADEDFEISFLSLFKYWKYHNKSSETLTKDDKRLGIILALFGDGQESGIRNLSEDEKSFILDSSGLKAEIYANLKNFADRLTPKNKSWLINNLNNPAGGIDDDWTIKEYGKEKTEAVNEIRAFVISEELVHLSQEKLNKILEIIKDGEGEGLNNFSLGDK
jgi:hypothetical protein